MSTFAKVAVTAIAVIAIGTVGVIALQPSGGRTAGSAPSPSPSPTPVPVSDGRAIDAATTERDVHVEDERDLDRVPRGVAHQNGDTAVDDDRLAPVRRSGR